MQAFDDLERKFEQERRDRLKSNQKELLAQMELKKSQPAISMTKEEENLNKKFTAMLELKSQLVSEIMEKEQLVVAKKSGKRIMRGEARSSQQTVQLLNL